MKAQTFKTSIKGYDNAVNENCWYKGDGMVEDVKIGTIMLIVVRPPKHTKNPEEYISRPPILRRIISLKQISDEEVPVYLRSYFKKKSKAIKLNLEMRKNPRQFSGEMNYAKFLFLNSL